MVGRPITTAVSRGSRRTPKIHRRVFARAQHSPRLETVVRPGIGRASWRPSCVSSLSLSLLIACNTSPPEDVVGPFTGETRRFVIDSVHVPPSDRNDVADKIRTATEFPTTRSPQRTQIPRGWRSSRRTATTSIAAGWRAGTIEITADAFDSDPTVGVRFVGPNDERSDSVGATLEDGSLRSNRTRYTRSPVTVYVRLPIFADADPSLLRLDGVEVDLSPDGRGGFDAAIRRGASPTEQAWQAATAGLTQMFESNPSEHLRAFHTFETSPRDWKIARKRSWRSSRHSSSRTSRDRCCRACRSDSPRTSRPARAATAWSCRQTVRRSRARQKGDRCRLRTGLS